MDSQARELCSLIAEIAFVLAGFSIIAMALRSREDDLPAPARLRAHALLFSSLSPGLLALLALGLSASGTGSDIVYRVVSVLWLVASTAFLVFSLRSRRIDITTSEATWDTASIVFLVALVPLTGLLVVNVLFLGSFWPVFAALFYQLLTATNAFYRLIFLGAR